MIALSGMSNPTAESSRRSSSASNAHGKTMFIESLRMGMVSESGKDLKTRQSGTVRFLMDIACCAGLESLHDSFADLAEALDLSPDIVDSVFEERPEMTADVKANLCIPRFVADLSRPGEEDRVLVQLFVRGRPAFFTSDSFARDFASSTDCEAVHERGGGDPDAVMRRLVCTRDRQAYLAAASSLFLGSGKEGGRGGEMLSEGSVVASIRGRRGKMLSLLEIRTYVSEDGGFVALGFRVTPDSSDEVAAADPFFYNLGRALKGESRGTPAPASPCGKLNEGTTTESSDEELRKFGVGNVNTSSFDNQRVYLEKKRFAQSLSPKTQSKKGP